MASNFSKLRPLIEDLRNHSVDDLAELRTLMNEDAPARPDPRRPGFFEIQGPTRVFYVFRYPNGSKMLLIGIWERDLAAEFAALSLTAA